MNYNREFLVPYLESICALELASKELENKQREISMERSKYKNGVYDAGTQPRKPVHYNVLAMLTIGEVISIISTIIFTVACLDFIGNGRFTEAITCGGIAAVVAYMYAVPAVKGMIHTLAEFKWKDKDYADDLKRYEEIMAKNEKLRQEFLPKYEDEYRKNELELGNIYWTKKEVYDANIIPVQFRNLYASVYLYDFFRTSQSTDLERALALFSLDEIKSRLDTIIIQQSEMIINQQIMIAEQRKTREQQEKHVQMMKEKLDTIVVTNEERNAYLGMIEANTKATAYFAAANYLK